MALWFPSTIHSTILATSLAAVVAVGLAGAAIYSNGSSGDGDVAPKADRLPVIAAADRYVTVETHGNGVSVLERIAID